jgi:putative Ca2+/H+ antiporter (TMEM165/GDT1 family)
MNALMICLIASAIAAFGGRWFLLVRAVSAKLPGAPVIAATLASAAIAGSTAAWMGGAIAAGARGPGMLLFLSLALLFAGAAMVLPARLPGERLMRSARRPVSAFILLLAAMLSDSAPFIILATAAWSGGTGFAMIGGIAGLTAAAMLALFPAEIPMSDAMMRRIRQLAGTVAIAVGSVVALSALGLL